MSTRAVAAAAPAATPEATAETAAKKTRTVAALDAEARALFQRRTSAVAAAKWAHENKVGSRKACSTGKFGNVTYNMVEPLLRELEQYGSISEDRDHAKQILTNDERRKLAEWILACGDGHNPKDRTQISAKVRQILKARHASNKKKRWRAGSVRLNEQEVSAAQSREPRLSTHFFQRFYPWCRAHGIKIEEGTARAQDQKRAAKMTEATVQRHFFGKYGLEAELIDAGIMDPETKVIKDPRRLLNSDETPQPIDAPQKGRRPKVAKRQGQSVRKSTTVNKEQVSVNMTWDLSGHMYGVQLVLDRKTISDDMVAEPPHGARQFDNTTDLAAMQSRYCTYSRTADGMQTQESFLQYLHQLDAEITARSNAEVAAGRPPIERPVVDCLDNHASRYSEEVLEACSGDAAKLGIRIFTEEAGTSGFLQSLDQYNSQFHRKYNKARDVYKEVRLLEHRCTLCCHAPLLPCGAHCAASRPHCHTCAPHDGQ
jgi:hypothetical protein